MAACARWNRAVPAWLRRHPAVHTVIVAEYAGGVWRTRARVSAAAAVVRGYERGLARLPASVTHLIVIRDNPHATLHTAACVVRAMGSHQAPGPACALARSRTLAPDPLVEAAATLRSRSVQTVDLTPFFCDADRCFPVVGGVLVYKDDNHMTLAWSKTLGPYLLRALDRGASSRVGQDLVRARTGPDSTGGPR